MRDVVAPQADAGAVRRLAAEHEPPAPQPLSRPGCAGAVPAGTTGPASLTVSGSRPLGPLARTVARSRPLGPFARSVHRSRPLGPFARSVLRSWPLGPWARSPLQAEQLGHGREGQRHPLGVEVPVGGRRRRSAPVRRTSTPSWRRSAGSNAPNVRRSSGRASMNASAGEPQIQPSIRPSSSRSCTSTVPLPARKPSTKAAPVGRRGAGRERPPERGASTSSGAQCPASCSRRRGPSPHQAVTRRPSASRSSTRRARSRWPAGWSTRASAAWVALEPLDHRRRRLVVEPAAAPAQPGDDAHDELVDDRRSAAGVGAPHVAVAQGAGRAGRARPSARRRRRGPRPRARRGGHRRPQRRRAGRRAGARSTARGQLGQARRRRRPARRRWSPRRLDAWCRGRRARRGGPTARAPSAAATSRGTSRSPRGPRRACPTARRGASGGGGGASGAAPSGCAGRARGSRSPPA